MHQTRIYRSEEQAKRLGLVEKQLIALEKEKKDAVAKAQVQERQLRESIKMKHILQSQVRWLPGMRYASIQPHAISLVMLTLIAPWYVMAPVSGGESVG